MILYLFAAIGLVSVAAYILVLLSFLWLAIEGKREKGKLEQLKKRWNHSTQEQR